MSLSRVLKAVTIGAATLAEGSRDVDLSCHSSDWKQLNITKDNNTVQVAYSISYPGGPENLPGDNPRKI